MAKPALNFVLPVPSLKHMSLARIAISLLSSSFNSGATTFENYGSYLGNILPKIAEDLIPKHDLENFKELLNILFCSFEYLIDVPLISQVSSRPKESFRHFNFTSRGTVNYIKTVQNFVSDESFSLVCRYRLACEYHLEDSIRALWERMQPDDFHQFHAGSIKNSEKYQVALWSLIMLDLEDEYELLTLLVVEEEDDVFPEISLNALAFKKLLEEEEDEYGVKCFVQKISEAERNAVLDIFVIDPAHKETTKLYFSLLSHQQLEIVLRSDHGLVALFRCLASNFITVHELFRRLFESYLSFIDEELFFQILLITTDLSDYPWDVSSFEWLWMHDQIPESYREYALSKPGKEGAALLLFYLCYDEQHSVCRWTWNFNFITRYARKDQFQVIFTGLIDLIQSYPVYYALRLSGIVFLLKICARKMVTSRVELDYVKEASSPILDLLEEHWKAGQENGSGPDRNVESWRVFLSNMERRFSESVNQFRPI